MEKSTFLQTEYAPSGRALCRGCQEKIEKTLLRIAVVSDFTGFHSEKWYHPKCLDKIPKQLKQEGDSPVVGIDNLKLTDRQIIKDLVIKLKTSTTTKKKESKKGSKKVLQKKESCQDEEPLHNTTKKSKKNDDQIVDVNSEEEDVEDDQKLKPRGYNDEQWPKYLTHVAELDKYTVAALKQMLKANEQSQNGGKSDLIERVADGMTLGQIAKCPHCGGGRPRFNAQQGKYKCPGFMEDTEFMRCNRVMSISEFERSQWLEI